MKEIGGYFGLDQFAGNEYYKNLIALNTGRNCLLYLLKAKNIKKVYLPYLNCVSIRDVCEKNGYEYEYYHTNHEFMPVFDQPLSDEQYLYIINYYGRITDDEIRALKEKYRYIIIDNAQAFFHKPLQGIDTLYSCRKFFGVPDGAYLSTDARLDENLETDLSGKRMKHILGRYEETAENYFADFIKNGQILTGESLKQMSRLTRNILGAVDYERACHIRNKNYRYLAERLDKENKLKSAQPDGPFAYPYYAENAMEIRKNLVQRKIYISTLWPNVLQEMPADSLEYEYSANILPLPCDQRYTTDDMQYIVEELKKNNERSQCFNLSGRI